MEENLGPINRITLPPLFTHVSSPTVLITPDDASPCISNVIPGSLDIFASLSVDYLASLSEDVANELFSRLELRFREARLKRLHISEAYETPIDDYTIIEPRPDVSKVIHHAVSNREPSRRDQSRNQSRSLTTRSTKSMRIPVRFSILAAVSVTNPDENQPIRYVSEVFVLIYKYGQITLQNWFN